MSVICCRSLSFILAALAAIAWTSTAVAQRRTTAVVSPEQVSTLLEVMKLGDTAKDVDFQPLKGDEKVKLSALTKESPVVLVVLRGYPGYQCPLCTRQVADLRASAEEFDKLGAQVVLVYPGPGPIENLKKLANEFLGEKELPKPFVMMVDPEYSFTNLYELRWNAGAETSYPSTFVLDKNRVVRFRKISTTHGDRAATKDILAALSEMKQATPLVGARER